MIRVVLAEDTYLTREGVARVIEQARDIECRGAARTRTPHECRSASSARTCSSRTSACRRPTRDEGIQLAGERAGTHPGVGVVVLSQHVELLYAFELFEQGTGDAPTC